MWYPDVVKFPEMNLYPENVQCPTCNSLVPITEKLFIKDIWTELVPIFLQTTSKYPFRNAIIFDNEHCHFMWKKPQADNEK